MDHLGEPVGEVVPTPLPVTATPAGQSATPTPHLLVVPTATPPAQTPELPSPTPEAAATAVPTAAPTASGVLPPDILRDPAKADITAANPACADLRDMPQATGAFLWPSPYQALSGGDFREGHPGFDLATPLGSPVHAADTGLVVFAGWSGLGYGNTVLIDHGNGYQTLYAHLSQVSIYCGARVEKGKLVGLSGDTGNSTGPHLHFEVRVPGGYINPLRVLPTP
jgi:murein DD-endopeptidase MepM/ murein hydrolase activator NlpD